MYLLRVKNICLYIWPPPASFSADTTHPSNRKIGQWWLPSFFSPSLCYIHYTYYLLLSNYHGSSFPRLLQAKWETLNDYPRGFGGWWQLTEKNGPEHVVFAFTLLKTGSNIRKPSPFLSIRALCVVCNVCTYLLTIGTLFKIKGFVLDGLTLLGLT